MHQLVISKSWCLSNLQVVGLEARMASYLQIGVGPRRASRWYIGAITTVVSSRTGSPVGHGLPWAIETWLTLEAL